MPLIRSIGPDGDGFTVVFSDGTKWSMKAADVPRLTRSAGPTATETFCNSRIATAFNARGMTAEVRLSTTTPLGGQMVVSDVSIPRGWWSE